MSATGIHITCTSCHRQMFLSLRSAKATIANEETADLTAFLGGVDINGEIKEEDMIEGFFGVGEGGADGAGGERAGGRHIRMIHSNRTRHMTGCYAQRFVPLEEFKRLVRVVEEARGGGA